jgi:predicted amidohydrolase
MKIAMIQSTPVAADPEIGLARLADFAETAAGSRADLLMTPEMYLTGYSIGADTVDRLAEPADGRYAQEVAAIARANHIAVLFGYPERGSDGRIYNSACLVDAAGTIQAGYRKTHLYGDVDRSQFSAGAARSQVVDLGPWRVALAICYDVEFPELIRSYALDGADLVLVPTANMVPYDAVATGLVPARAQENALFLAYCNYVGAEGDFTYCGLSCVCGPDGEDIARGDRGEALILADLDHDRVAATRRDVRHLQDRRPELYI